MSELHNFFISEDNIKDDSGRIKGSDLHHLKNVLRMERGDKLFAITTSGKFEAIITDITETYAEIRLIQLIEPKVEPKHRINLLQAIPKGKKFDLIIEKATELGVSKIYPLFTSRVDITINPSKESNKLERWRRKAFEASKQCRRLKIPDINEPIQFDEIFDLTDKLKDATKIIFWELEEENSLTTLFSNIYPSSEIFLLVGPEGGFSIKEVEEAIKHNFIKCSLGKWILRTETAGPFAVGLVSYILWEKER